MTIPYATYAAAAAAALVPVLARAGAQSPDVPFTTNQETALRIVATGVALLPELYPPAGEVVKPELQSALAAGLVVYGSGLLKAGAALVGYLRAHYGHPSPVS